MTTEVLLRAPVSRARLWQLQRQAHEVLRRGDGLTLVVHGTDVSVVDAVARLALLAARVGGRLEVVGADADVFDACGLRGILSAARDRSGDG